MNRSLLFLLCMLFSSSLFSQQTIEIELPILLSHDDAEENNLDEGSVNTIGDDLELVDDPSDGNRTVGLRFNEARIPADAVLESAFLQFQAEETGDVATSIIIEGELAVQSAPFAEENFNVSARTRTSTLVEWNNIPPWNEVGQRGPDQRSPDVSSIVNEIISQAGWEFGNPITFIITGQGLRTATGVETDLSYPTTLVLKFSTNCNPLKTPCDDGDPTTYGDYEDGNCNCVGVPEKGFVMARVTRNNDDGEERESGRVSVGDNDLNLGDFNEKLGGIRFPLDLPSGAIISNAFIQFTVDAPTGDTSILHITCEDTIHSEQFLEEDFNISMRPTIPDSVIWDVPEWSQVGIAGIDQKTPSLASMVQKVIDKPGWERGNAISFLINGSGLRYADAYFADDETTPKLVVNYYFPGATCPPQGTACDDGDPLTTNDEEDGSCNCIGYDETRTTNNYTVEEGSDDAEESTADGSVDVSSTILNLGTENGVDQMVGVRFTNLGIPPGSVVDRAFIQFTADAAGNMPTTLSINGEMGLSSGTFEATQNNISQRTTSTTTATWSDVLDWDNSGDASLDQRTIYITDVVNEVVSQDGWSLSNALTFIISGSGNRIAQSFDGNASPRLVLIFKSNCPEKGTLCDDGDENTTYDLEDGNCNCIGIPLDGTLDYQINRPDNDAEETVATGDVDLNSSDLEMGEEGGDTPQVVGLRFTDVHLPSSADIKTAFIQFTVGDDNVDVTNISIKAEIGPNSEKFKDLEFDITSRSTSVDSILWENIPSWEILGESGPAQRTPNIAPLVREILEHYQWDILNSMTFFLEGTGEREAESFDGSAIDAPRLIIEYEVEEFCLPVGTPCDDGDANTILDEEDGNCNCVGLPADINIASSSTMASSNDAEEDILTGELDVGSSDLELIRDGDDQIVGIRFDNIQIPDGIIVDRAHIQFQVDEPDEELTNLIFTGEAVIDSKPFTEDSLFDISKRSFTTNSVAWNNVEEWVIAGTKGLNQRTPYVTDIVNEIISLEGWTTGDPITFLINGEGVRTAESSDGSGGPILTLYYQGDCPVAGTPCDDGDASTAFDEEDGLCNCAGTPTSGIIEIKIIDSNYDAEEEVATGGIELGSSDLELSFESGNTEQEVGLSFANIPLPANTNIEFAYIQFTVDDDNADQTDLIIKGEANPNPAPFTATLFDISSRPKTTTEIAWPNVPVWEIIGEADFAQQTPDLTTLISEMIAHPDWKRGNAMNFYITGTGEREAESFDGEAESAPKLVLLYNFEVTSTKNQNLKNFKVYPNPTDGQLTIDLGKSTGSLEIEISDVQGKRMKRFKEDNSAGKIDLNINEFPVGFYFIHLKANGELFRSQRIAKMD